MIPSFITSPTPSIYLGDSFLVIDTECTIRGERAGARLPENELLYTYMKLSDGGMEIEGGELELSRYLDMFYSVDFIVGHGIKFDLQWLMRAGLKIEKVLIYDTMVGEYVLAGNRKLPLDLNRTGQRYGMGPKENYVDMMMGLGECPSHYPASLLQERCKQDVATTHKIFLKQRQKLAERSLLPVMYTRCIFTPVLAEMEMNGMFLNKKEVNAIHKEKVATHAEITKELDGFTGAINMASPQQVADFIYNTLKFAVPRNKRRQKILGKPTKTFPEGTPKTNEATIASLKPSTKKQKRFLELKSKESKLRKAITTYTSLFREACEHDGCMLYGNLNQTITATHRLSSSKPNLQNIDSKLKRLVVPRNENWKIRQNDYKSLEFIVAGFLSQDERLYKDVTNSEFDAHDQSAEVIFGNSFVQAVGESRKELRRRAKRHTFKPLFGGQSGTKEEQAYYKWFLERYTGVANWHQALLDEALDTHKLVMDTGLIFYFPNVKFTSSGYVEDQTVVKNIEVQSFATGDIAPIGVTMLWHRMKDEGVKSFLINTVHDSALLEEHPDEDLSNLSHSCMSKDVKRYLKQVYRVDYNFPLTIESIASDHWSG